MPNVRRGLRRYVDPRPFGGVVCAGNRAKEFAAPFDPASHRGPTHSLLLLPPWALPLSWVLAKILREPGGWRALYGVCALGIGAHIAGDWITSFGTMLLAPLSDWRAGIGTTFIIDLWFSGIILVGLILSITTVRLNERLNC